MVGTIHTLAGVRSHAAGPVGKGRDRGDVVECPSHGARFEVRSGKADMPPATDDVPTVAVRIEGD